MPKKEEGIAIAEQSVGGIGPRMTEEAIELATFISIVRLRCSQMTFEQMLEYQEQCINNNKNSLYLKAIKIVIEEERKSKSTE